MSSGTVRFPDIRPAESFVALGIALVVRRHR